MACKSGEINTIREQAVIDKPFKTKYYSLAKHRAAQEEIPLLSE